jgi:hypothetical protein
MIVWLILVSFCAAINLFVFIALRGRWGRLVPFLAVASLIGSAAGNAIGGRLGLDVLRVGSFDLLAASVGAQLAMVATLLLAVLVPSTGPPADDS